MSTQDFGIIITQPGQAVSGAPASKVSLNTSNPFFKIDTQNSAGFQSILLSIVTDPPNPVAPATDAYTTLYKFKHGYNYIPSIEMLCYVSTPPAGVPAGSVMTYFQDWGQIGAQTAGDGVYVYAVADATWVYIIVDKFVDSGFGGLTTNLSGTNLQITIHTFVEDIGV